MIRDARWVIGHPQAPGQEPLWGQASHKVSSDPGSGTEALRLDESALSPVSLAAHQELPSDGIRSSDALRWRSVLARSYEHPVETEEFTTAPTPDLLVGIALSGTLTIECRRPRGWAKATLRPGAVGVTAPGTSSTLRWRGASPRPTSLHLHLSAALLQATAEELGNPRLVEQLPDALLLEDTTVLTLARALGVALEREAQPLYADSLAQAMAAHMLYGRLLGSGRPKTDRAAQAWGPAVRRVVDHVHDHLAEELTLDDLAAVARLSRYQLIRAFTRTLGLTPHRYLVSMRMRRAAELLSRSEYSVTQISALCGYASRGQFITAFGRYNKTSPTRYRREIKEQPRAAAGGLEPDATGALSASRRKFDKYSLALNGADSDPNCRV